MNYRVIIGSGLFFALAATSSAGIFDSLTTGAYNVDLEAGMARSFDVADVPGGLRMVETTILSDLFGEGYSTETRVGNGRLTSSSDFGVKTKVKVGYGFAANASGVKEVDLNWNLSGSDRFSFDFTGEGDAGYYYGNPVQATISVRSNSDNGISYSSQTRDIYFSGQQDFYFNGFGDFDFGDVDQMTLTITGASGKDWMIKSIGTDGTSIPPVPEPSAMLLLAAGGAMAYFRRRKI